MTNIVGALVSVTLVIGIGVWGYKLLIRDVSGVPIVRATEGEMRIIPDDPGGQLAQHQGLAVNRVAAEGAAEKPADRLVLAPADVGLADEDQPIPAAMVAPVQQPKALEPADQSTPASTAAVATDDAASIDALVAELTNGVAPIEDAAQAETATPLPDDTQMAAVATTEPGSPSVASDATAVAALSEAPGVRNSKRPQLRPASAPAVVTPASAAPAELVAEVSADEIPAGTRLVQLGAFDSPEVARDQWTKLNSRFDVYLAGKSRVVQKAKSGGRIFYRLRALGFADLSDARQFCSALVAENADCIPVITK
ncbi:MAG: SPOR domain-containing protein [Sulfitobacter sp.]